MTKKRKQTKVIFDYRRIGPYLIIALFMFVTVWRVAEFAGSFEHGNWTWLGWPYAIGVDLAIVFCAIFTRWDKPRVWAWVGYFTFAAASGVMNVAAIDPLDIPGWVYSTFPTCAIMLMGFLARQVDKLAGVNYTRKGDSTEDSNESAPDSDASAEQDPLLSGQLPPQLAKAQRTLELLREQPELSQKQIAQLQGKSRQAIGQHIRLLKETGYLR